MLKRRPLIIAAIAVATAGVTAPSIQAYAGNEALLRAPVPPQTAPANQIVLFDGESFQGDRIAFGDTVPNLDGTGFNDRATSISVRGGAWEVCFDADFQGGCMQLQPGDYQRLDPPFDRSISSVRPLGGADYAGNYAAVAASPPGNDDFGVPGASIGIDLPSYPELVPVPGYPVYYAPQVNSNYFFYDGMYWAYQRDNWYASSWYNGPWARVAPAIVPLFVLRVPVRYYRRPPAYFRGWSSEAPPRWSERWGNAWAQSHRGWDNWNRYAAPAPAPLPAYQRQYSGNRYPAAAQQRTIQSQNYRYRPQDAVVRQHYQAQQGAAPRPRGQPPQRAGAEVQRPASPAPIQQAAPTVPRPQPPHRAGAEVQRPASPAPIQQAAPTVPRTQPPQSGRREAQRPASPAPTQQVVAPVPRPQPPQWGRREAQRPASPAPIQQAAPAVPRPQPPERGRREAQRPATPAPTQQVVAPVPRGQPPQSGRREAQRPAASASSQPGSPTAGEQPQQPEHAQEQRHGPRKG